MHSEAEMTSLREQFNQAKTDYDTRRSALGENPTSKQLKTLGREPKAPKEGISDGRGEIEYHPPGGYHSMNKTEVGGDFGGSYFRFSSEGRGGADKTTTRNSRYGEFGADKLIDDTARSGKAADPGSIERRQPNISDSPPPSPATAQAILNRSFTEKQAVMDELAAGKPYREIASPPATNG
ncbi:hypothetical protein WJ33_10955 [Burkholderia ubonensis]|uniref:Uncharacterized protein n=2 Tax=Burkholderia ubonensis TaxID=101571 RepID=A0A103QMK2_9BURK|nr:hypothetical protein WJ33_10955 [Burkholderia ubonensis]